MTTRTPTGRAIEVPNLLGVRADRAIEMLREVGLLPITWAAEVKDVNEAGFVVGLDPPSGTLVRPNACITMGVAAHPDFAGHADDSLPGNANKVVESTLAAREIDGCSPISPVEHPDDLAQVQERGFLPMQLW